MNIKPFNYNRGTKAAIKRGFEATGDINPRNLVERLNEFVVGSETAKKRLAILGYKHWKKTKRGDTVRHGPTSSLMFVGKTGTGKTYLVQTLANLLGLPFVHVDCSSITQSGYMGNNLSDIAVKLAGQPNATNAIIFLDEIDKLASAGEGSTVATTGVQYELLRILEGTQLDHQARSDEARAPAVHTGKMLFVAAGSFKDITWEEKKKPSMGFHDAPADEGITQEELEDKVRKYGIIPELLGRFSSITKLDDITPEVMLKILNTRSGNLQKYLDMFEDEGVKLKITHDAKKAISQKAMTMGTGARALLKVLENIFESLQYDHLGLGEPKSVELTKEMVDKVL